MPDASTPVPTTADWTAWARRLEDALLALADGAGLTVTAPESAARPALLRRARLRGFVPAKHEQLRPWVRLTRSEDHLRGACVGPGDGAGRLPMAPEEREALTALGWHEPHPLEGEDLVRWWPDDVPTGPFLPTEDARRAALMVAETFRTVLAVPVEEDGAPGLPTVTTD